MSVCLCMCVHDELDNVLQPLTFQNSLSHACEYPPKSSLVNGHTPLALSIDDTQEAFPMQSQTGMVSCVVRSSTSWNSRRLVPVFIANSGNSNGKSNILMAFTRKKTVAMLAVSLPGCTLKGHRKQEIPLKLRVVGTLLARSTIYFVFLEPICLVAM